MVISLRLFIFPQARHYEHIQRKKMENRMKKKLVISLKLFIFPQARHYEHIQRKKKWKIE